MGEPVIRCGVRHRRGVMGMRDNRKEFETVGYLSLCVLLEGNRLTGGH
jgi:hypothetical protein